MVVVAAVVVLLAFWGDELSVWILDCRSRPRPRYIAPL
jgi:hypothetical protein